MNPDEIIERFFDKRPTLKWEFERICERLGDQEGFEWARDKMKEITLVAMLEKMGKEKAQQAFHRAFPDS